MNPILRARARITLLLNKTSDRVKNLTELQEEIQRTYPGSLDKSETFQALRRETEHETGYAAGLSRAMYEIDRALAEEKNDEET